MRRYTPTYALIANCFNIANTSNLDMHRYVIVVHQLSLILLRDSSATATAACNNLNLK